MKGRRNGGSRSMVIAGLFGALAAVTAIPAARSTVGAQVALALGWRPEWLRAATGGARARLRQVASARPDDVALRVGLATLPDFAPNRPDASEGSWDTAHLDYSRVPRRLAALSLRFPENASIRAHLLRHLMVSEFRIERPELAEFVGPVPKTRRRPSYRVPSPEALRAFMTAAAAGARLEPGNAYFDAMRAVGEFAARQDEAALRDLHAAAQKPGWNDHAIGETQAQWKLLDMAYGDRGVVQKSFGIENLLFPHLMALRAAAQLAVWHAAQRERAGDPAAVRTIRHDVMQLGVTMAAASPSMIGNSVGVGIFGIGMKPVPADPPRSAPSREALEAAEREWRTRYERSLRAQGEVAEADWVRVTRQRVEAIQDEVQTAMNAWQDVAPYSPERWEGWWTFGILLLEEMAILGALWGAAMLLAWRGGSQGATAAQPAALGWAAIVTALLVTAYVVLVVAQAFGMSWRDFDLGMTLRLFAGLAVFLGGLRLWTRGGASAAETPARQQALVGVAAFLAVCVAPTLLWTATGSTPVLSDSVLTGLAAMGILALARRAGRPAESASSRPRWKPALVAFLSVLPTLALSFAGRDIFSHSNLITFRLLATQWFWVTPTEDPGRFLPALLLLPAVLLVLFQLFRVVALQRPLRSGLARGLRQTAPAAVMMLLTVYLVALVPTIARDRAAEHRVEQMLSDQLRYSPKPR